VVLEAGDCRDLLRTLPDACVDAIVTDPPYELGFMGKSWDASGIAYDVSVWRECLRVLKPGGHMVAFSGSRTYHRMAVAIEDAGFEIRDQIMWIYGSGFPKSLDVSKAIDRALGAKREQVKPKSVIGPQRNIGNRRPYMDDPNHTADSDIPASDAARRWGGWGTALKPAHEPICVARKPLAGTVAANVLAHGTGALNIDGCRVATDESTKRNNTAEMGYHGGNLAASYQTGSDDGRWPANIIHDGGDEVIAAFPGNGETARFFYCAKASKTDRGDGNTHPTVKPNALMRYLCRLITAPGGLVLDPFAGSGSTALAAHQEGFRVYGCDLDPSHIKIASERIERARRN
jgi:site-specific DNA-methyltransferase (adenine-specific)